MFIGKYNKSVILTYLSVVSSVIGMIFVFNDRIDYAMIALIISGVCDLFDGKVARMCKRDAQEKKFGVQIDSLADTVSFLAFPCVIGIHMFSGANYFIYIALILFVLAGIIRLGWFNIIADEEKAVKHYVGLPVTYISLILPLLYIFNSFFNISNYIFLGMYIVVAFLFILNIKIPKPKGIWYFIFLILAIISVSGILILR